MTSRANPLDGGDQLNSLSATIGAQLAGNQTRHYGASGYKGLLGAATVIGSLVHGAGHVFGQGRNVSCWVLGFVLFFLPGERSLSRVVGEFLTNTRQSDSTLRLEDAANI